MLVYQKCLQLNCPDLPPQRTLDAELLKHEIEAVVSMLNDQPNQELILCSRHQSIGWDEKYKLPH